MSSLRHFEWTPEVGTLIYLAVPGRQGQALGELIHAGSEGITSLDAPAIRPSDSIFKLRRRGLAIETIYEPHGGEFPGSHGRYCLRSAVREVAVPTSAAARAPSPLAEANAPRG
jgi:hypothetical protein